MAVYDAILWKLRMWDPAGTVDYAQVPKLTSWVGSPVWVVTPTKVGDEYINTTTKEKRYAKWATSADRVLVNYLI